MPTALKPVPILGRILLALIFVQGGIGKLGNPARTATEMASHGIPFANILIYGVILVELGGGLMVIAGLYARCAATVLFFYTLALAVLFHAYWAAAPAAQGTQHALFFGHLSMMGGMLIVAAFGAGPLSLDALRERSASAAR